MKVGAILTDIEGTTTSIEFARDVLFPLSLREIEAFVRSNWNRERTREELQAVQSGIAAERNCNSSEVTIDDVIDKLQEWIREDKKERNLKSIQGKIWRQSFESGALKGHVYADVPRNFEKWRRGEILISIFSSGSIEAQQLIFRYSETGDLTRYIQHYFDTTTGAKKDPNSYLAIAAAMGMDPSRMLFLSDAIAELDAARQAGIQTIQVVRDAQPAIQTATSHPRIYSFDELHID